ncbi:MAG: DUF1838 family protein [Gammaproteobacteria bacterium]
MTFSSGIRPLLLFASMLACTAAGADTTVLTGRQAWEVQRKSTCGTLRDRRVRFGIFEGRAYSRIPGEKDRHIFNVLGVNTRQCGTVTDAKRGPGFRSVSREVMLYLDPETNAVLDTWKNPWTGNDVEVVHVANDPVNMRAPRFETDENGAPITATLRLYGDIAMTSFEVPLFYDNPLGGEYQAYVGGHYHAMEIFNTTYVADEILHAESLGRSYISWVRVAQWLPWMEMGSRPGLMIVNATGFSSWKREDIPEPLMSVLRERYPSYFEPPPVDDARPNETSWTVFRKRLETRSTGRR